MFFGTLKNLSLPGVLLEQAVERRTCLDRRIIFRDRVTLGTANGEERLLASLHQVDSVVHRFCELCRKLRIVRVHH